MTKEELINHIKYNLEINADIFLTDEDARMVIEALEQESCGDAISRQAVIDAIDKWVKNMGVLIALPASEVTPLFDSIHKLPSVNQQESVIIKMRDATPEERESIYKYINSISKPTGVDFWNLEQEPIWIPISKYGYPKPEDEYKYFLTTDNKGEITIQEFLLSLDEEPQPYFSGMRNIVAYMPLPKPYRRKVKEYEGQ